MVKNFHDMMGAQRKRRLAEILEYPLDIDVRGVPTKYFRPDIHEARSKYLAREKNHEDLDLVNTRIGDLYPRDFSMPAFARDVNHEIHGKFDLVLNTASSLYNEHTPSVEPGRLVFHFTGIEGFQRLDDDNVMNYLIEMNIYDGNRGVVMTDGRHMSGEELETEIRLRNQVDEAFRYHLTEKKVEPVATLVPFEVLKKHIQDSNNILMTQYGDLMRGGSLNDLKRAVIERHGPDSIVALMVHMKSPEHFYKTFIPRGIVSSLSTGKNVPYSDGRTYGGIVTIQTQGRLRIDIEDGASHLTQGDVVDMATLYLIVEMKEPIPDNNKFNYPSIRLFLSPLSQEQLERQLTGENKGSGPKTRDGRPSEIIVEPIGNLSVGPYHIAEGSNVSHRQSANFDLLLSRGGARSLIFS